MNWVTHFHKYLIKVVYIIVSLLKFVYVCGDANVNGRGGGEEI